MVEICLFAAFLTAGLAPAGNPPSAGKPAAARSDVEKLVRRYYQDVAAQADLAKSFKAADDLLSGDFSFTFGTGVPTRGIGEHKNWLAWHHRVAADQAWTVQDLVVENESAAVRFLLTFTHQDTFRGVPATGKTITTRGMDFFRISDGRIVNLYRVFDVRDVLEQMGAPCPPQPPKTAMPTPRP